MGPLKHTSLLTSVKSAPRLAGTHREIVRLPEPFEVYCVVRILFRNFAVILIVLLLIVVPFAIFGQRLDAWVEYWLEKEQRQTVLFGGVVGLLAGDIFLPTPSSLISTMAGWKLHWHVGGLASWLGMSLGAILGFGLARRVGWAAAWLAREDDLRQMSELCQRFGPWMLVISRAVPVLAEASVLIVGMHRLSWRRFLPPVLLSNLGISLVYSCIGDFARAYGGLPLAVGASIALPVVVATLFRRVFPTPPAQPEEEGRRLEQP